MTGLYAQQHCLFQASFPGIQNTPPLIPNNPNWVPGGSGEIPGFPTIGNVLSQLIPQLGTGTPYQYNCTYIGKWHLSCASGIADGNNGQNGPRDYEFNSIYSIPNIWTSGSPYSNSAYPSLDGMQNEGTGGDFLDSYTQSPPGRDVPNFGSGPFTKLNAEPNFLELNDAAIAWAFTHGWLPYANANLNMVSGGQLQKPWFCAVSFVHPHDITDFPYSYGLTIGGAPYFTDGLPTSSGVDYQPPPYSSTPASYSGTDCPGGSCGGDDTMYLSGVPSVYTSLPLGVKGNGGWNCENLASSAPSYTNHGKPGMQLAFQLSKNSTTGNIQAPGIYAPSTRLWSAPTAWKTFLNYYSWMQSCVDYQVGRVLGSNPGSTDRLYQYPVMSNNTVILFTSDHGEYGGSHGLHTKGGAAYDEAINVPLYVSFPSMRGTPSGQKTLTYTCSSVDILPFLYSIALGNEIWRSNSDDMVYYPSNRESPLDAIYKYQNSSYTLQQRRISSISMANPLSGPDYNLSQPFILHTVDDYAVAPGATVPSHIVAFRTVDETDINGNSAPYYPVSSNGGGKLVIYSYWNTCGQVSAPIMGINNATTAPNQYEFYNYSPDPFVSGLNANPQEIGNQMFNSTGSGNTIEAQAYFNDFYGISVSHGNNIQNELYNLNTGTSPGNNTLQVAAAVVAAYQNYRNYLIKANKLTGPTGNNADC